MDPPTRHDPFGPGELRPATHEDIDWARVRRVTVVPFLAGGHVVLVTEGPRLAVPQGHVEPGEDVLLDTCTRVPLATAGFRRQGTHVVAASADAHHLVAWVDGDRYRGPRPRRRHARWWTGTADDAARLLRDQGDDVVAGLVDRADHDRRQLSDARYVADARRVLEAAYVRADTPQGGSGFGGDAGEWRSARSVLGDAVNRDGTFLDLGCANGLLMASMARWAAEKGLRIEPYGVDISPGLVELARRRLPGWSDRLWVGDALGWVPPDGRRFDTVHVLLDCVPARRYGDLVAHLLDVTVAPGGHLLVSNYIDARSPQAPASVLAGLGHRVAGVTGVPRRRGRPDGAPSAWLVHPPDAADAGHAGNAG